MPKHDSPNSDPAWYIFHGDRRPNPDNLLSDDLKAKLKPEDAPPWRRFDRVSARSRGAQFLVSEREKARINAALMLRRPLLITGPPGVGKTSLTYAVAHELGLAPVLRWSITSRTRLQDGLYHYDPVARLQDTPRFASEAPRPQSNRRRPIPGLDRNLDKRPPIERYLKLGPLGTAFAGFAQPAKYAYPRVLLIDEIDKSDVDLPNDLLHIFEEGHFDIDELKRDKADRHWLETEDGEHRVEVMKGRVSCGTFPFVVMTSNAEREFPPAFLRRCIQLDMYRPDEVKLRRIVEVRLQEEDPEAFSRHADLINEIVHAFHSAASEKDLATDQLLNVVLLVMKGIDPFEGIQPLDEHDKDSLIGALWKSLRDEHV
jgi:MoxR-like ATPase